MGVTAWSPSRYGLYEECPRKFKYKIVDKLPEEEGPALARGTEIHGQIEDYIAGRTNKKPEIHVDILEWIEWLKAEYRERVVKVEMQLALTKKWALTKWFAADCWLRVKIDAYHSREDVGATAIDWKTGKHSAEKTLLYNDALDIYATVILSLGLDDAVVSHLVFTDAGIVVPPNGYIVIKEELEDRQKYWERKVHSMMTDTLYAPNPSFRCR